MCCRTLSRPGCLFGATGAATLDYHHQLFRRAQGETQLHILIPRKIFSSSVEQKDNRHIFFDTVTLHSILPRSSDPFCTNNFLPTRDPTLSPERLLKVDIMNAAPERRESTTAHDKSSTEVSRSELLKNFTADSQKPLLPAGLLHSSPEIGSTSQTIMDTVTTTADQQTAAAGYGTLTPQPPRLHDVIMERNDQFEDEVWMLMSGGHLLPRDRSSQEPQTVPDTLAELGPAEPSTPHQNRPQSRPTEQPATFLLPGQGRTPQEMAAAANLRAAVAARARHQGEAERARQANLAALTDWAEHEGVEAGNDSSGQESGLEAHQGRPAQFGGLAGAAGPAATPIQMPTLLGPQTLQQAPHPAPQPAPFPAPANNSSSQHIPTQGSRQPANTGGGTVHNHKGDSIFRQMMDQLIANGRAPPDTYHQVGLPSRAPYGMEYLYFAEWIDPQHPLFHRAGPERGDSRAIRSAKNGEIVGWQEFLSGNADQLHLIRTPNPGKWVAEDGKPREPSSGRRRR